MTRSSYRAWCGVIGRVLPKPAALMREALSETLPVRIATGEIRAYLPVSSDEGMAAGSGTSLWDVSPPNLVGSRSREIGCYNDRIVLEFDRHLDSAAAEVPVKFQSDWNSLKTNLAASRLHEPRGGYSLYDGWYICAALLTPFFLNFWGLNTIFWGYFFHPSIPKRSFWVPILPELDLFGPKFQFCLDLLGSNFPTTNMPPWKKCVSDSWR